MTAACTYLLEQCALLATTALMAREDRDARSGVSQEPDHLREAFGPLIEGVMNDHADLVLAYWDWIRSQPSGG